MLVLVIMSIVLVSAKINWPSLLGNGQNQLCAKLQQQVQIASQQALYNRVHILWLINGQNSQFFIWNGSYDNGQWVVPSNINNNTNFSDLATLTAQNFKKLFDESYQLNSSLPLIKANSLKGISVNEPSHYWLFNANRALLQTQLTWQSSNAADKIIRCNIN